MRTWGETAGLAVAALRLWRRFLPELLFWFALGYAVNLAGRYASTLLGTQHLLLATLCQGVSMVATACATLLMMNALGPGLPAYQRLVASFAVPSGGAKPRAVACPRSAHLPAHPPAAAPTP